MGRVSGGGGRSAGATTTREVFGATNHEVKFNAQEYAQATGVSVQEAQARFKSINEFTGSEYKSIRKSQRDGKDSIHARNIEAYLKTAKKYDGEVYRGMALKSVDDFYARYGGLNGTFKEKSMNSWSSDLDVAKTFALPRTERNVSVIFKVKNKTGASIRNTSNFKHESEVLVGKNAIYRVKSLKVKGKKGKERIEADLVQL